MFIRFLGTGNAFNHGGRANQCFFLKSQRGSFLLDCGSTSLLQMARHKIPADNIDAVLLTHLHGDHALGLPMLLLHWQYQCPEGRERVLVGPPGIEDFVARAWECAYPDVARKKKSFGLRCISLDGGKRQSTHLLDLGLDAIDLRHSVPVNGYRINAGAVTVALSGDTGPCPGLSELGAEADLLVVECNSWEPVRTGNHLSVRDLEEACPWGARSVALVHTGPKVQENREELIARLGVIFPADGDAIMIEKAPAPIRRCT